MIPHTIHNPLRDYLASGPAGGAVHVLIATTVLVAGVGAAWLLCRMLRRMTRHGAYGYHRERLAQARQAGDVHSIQYHELRVRLLADQLDKDTQEGQA